MPYKIEVSIILEQLVQSEGQEKQHRIGDGQAGEKVRCKHSGN